MAESVSRRLNEYLRNGQAAESMGQPQPGYEGSQDGVAVGRASEWDAQRHRMRDRRSSITSFADLYERAVKNLLNIRPLFDPSLDIFGPKISDGAVHSHPAVPIQPRQYAAERGQQRETREPDGRKSEKQNQRPADLAHGPIDFSYRDGDHSTNGFFEHVLAEHARHNRHAFPYLPQRRGLAAKQRESTSHTRTETSTVAHMNTGHSGHQKENVEQHHYWKHGNEQRHRPSMFDDLRYHARLVLSAEVNARKVGVSQEGKVKLENNGADIKVEEDSTTNEPSLANGAKLTDKEQMDLIRERIIKENQKLKYRPYSLRSKRNDIKRNKKVAKKKKLKKKNQLKSLWKPATPQEMFLAQFGLMRKILEQPKVSERSGSGTMA